jgi:ketosteroid isomerase-like protein
MLALGRGDVDGFLDGLAEDVEWHGGGVLLPVGTWRGREQLSEGLHASAEQRGEISRVVLREMSAAGARVLLLGVIERHGHHGFATVPNSWICEVQDGRIRRLTAYASDAAARAAWTGAR